MSRNARLVRHVGLALIVAGLVAGAAVYATASADPDADAVAEQREMRAVARLSGTAGVETAQFDHWFGSLWHGRRLAFTLAAVGLALGVACRHVGGLMAEE